MPTPTPTPPTDPAAERARRDLERVRMEGDVLGTPMARLDPADRPDRVEIWATRVGRGLAVAFVLWVLWTYVVPLAM